MDTKKEISEFLTSRRARVSPEQAGLTSYGARRVPGLRREEVAVLAGVSVPYYTRLERGDMSGASDGVLEALAPTSSISPAPLRRPQRALAGDRPSRASVPRSSGPSTRSPAQPRT